MINTELDVKVTRNSFFETPGQKTLSFQEVFPPKLAEKCHEDKDICGCTKSVQLRPSGIPSQITQSIKLVGDLNDDLKLDLDLTSGWLSFLPKKSTRPTLMGGLDFDSRIYFTFGKNQCGLQIPVKGYNGDEINCLLGHLYLGNDVDISKLYNGHSPSKIIDLKTIDKDDVWAHGCVWGNEQIRFLPKDSDVSYFWKDSITLMNEVIETFSKLNVTNVPINDVYKTAADNFVLLVEIFILYPRLLNIAKSFEDNPVFKMISEIDKQNHEDMIRKVKNNLENKW